MSHKLPSTIHPGIVRAAGITPESHTLTERLLETDRVIHHCLFNNGIFHNHLSHHLLALYDLGAPEKILQAVWDSETKDSALIPLDMVDRSTLEPVTEKTWTKFLGEVKYYSSYLTFFSEEIVANGVGPTLEKYIFNPSANANGSEMLSRLVGGVLHPFIQLGYATEFGSDAMVAQALGQAAVHQPFVPELYDPKPTPHSIGPVSLFEILRLVYDSDILTPVMPYDPDALLSTRTREACKHGRPEEIRRLSALWFSADETEEQLNVKVEELLWATTLLLTGTGKPGRKPRLDFFLMHLLNATIFLPSLLKAVPTQQSRVQLTKAFLATALMVILLRGRPRIDTKLIMSYSANPSPPHIDGAPNLHPDSSAMGDPNDLACINPWINILSSVIHVPDAHTVKAIRALHYASQHYGHTSTGKIVGTIDNSGQETLKGIGKVDGTVFVRAAGVIMDTLGWVSHGQTAGNWDRSALGWDDAWKGGD